MKKLMVFVLFIATFPAQGMVAEQPVGTCDTIAVQFRMDQFFWGQRRSFETQYRQYTARIMRELGYATMTPASTWELGLLRRETRVGARSSRHSGREVQASCTMLVTLTSYNPETSTVGYGNRGVRTTQHKTRVESFVTLELITNDGTGIVQKYGDGNATAVSTQLSNFSLNLPDIKYGEKRDEGGRVIRRAKRIDLGQIRTSQRNDTRGRAAREAAVDALVNAFGSFQ